MGIQAIPRYSEKVHENASPGSFYSPGWEFRRPIPICECEHRRDSALIRGSSPGPGGWEEVGTWVPGAERGEYLEEPSSHAGVCGEVWVCVCGGGVGCRGEMRNPFAEFLSQEY